LAPDAERAIQAVRQHWGVENSLHWVLDVTFCEDESRVCVGNAPENLALVRKITHNLLQQEKALKRGVKTKRFVAVLDDDYLLKILCLKPSDSLIYNASALGELIATDCCIRLSPWYLPLQKNYLPRFRMAYY